MYNTMNGSNVADKLGLGPETRELKLGSSFTSGGRGQQGGSFHSVRYDFKPASVDTSKMATLDVGPNGQVTISMPNVDGNGTTVFKGARKPYAKECVLIIDQDTGEVVLEKLTHNIQVKRTREEGGSKKSGSLAMPVVPSPHPSEIKKSQPPPSLSSFKPDPKTAIRDREEPKKVLPSKSVSQLQHPPNSSKRSPMPLHHQQRLSPNNGPSPSHITSPNMSFSPSTGSSQEPSRPTKQQPSVYSLTDFDDLLSMTPINPQPAAAKPSMEKVPVKENVALSVPSVKPSAAVGGSSTSSKNVSAALSESSSNEDSSSSSSSEDDDDDSSDLEDVPDKIPIPAVVPTVETTKTPSLVNSNSRGRPQPVAPSMPTDLLCEDLQLSESGSDSD